jgi:hypothetical protein
MRGQCLATTSHNCNQPNPTRNLNNRKKPTMKKLILFCALCVLPGTASTALADSPHQNGRCWQSRPYCGQGTPMCICEAWGQNCHWICVGKGY